MAEFTPSLLKPCNLNEISVTQKRICGAKMFYREHALAYPNHNFMTRGGPELFTSVTIFMKCGVKTSSGSGMLHPENQLGRTMLHSHSIAVWK